MQTSLGKKQCGWSGKRSAGKARIAFALGGRWHWWLSVPPTCHFTLVYWGDTTGISQTAWVWSRLGAVFLETLSLHMAGALATSSFQSHMLIIPEHGENGLSLWDPGSKFLRKTDWCTLAQRDPTPGPRTGLWGRGRWAEEGDWSE